MGVSIDWAAATDASSVFTARSYDSAATDVDGTAVCPTTATDTSSTYTAFGFDVSAGDLDITAS